jgi:outer membrane receptor for monomeric catechols
VFDDDSGFQFNEIRTLSVPLRLRYFHPSGVFAGAGLTYVSQDFTDLGGDQSSNEFFIADLSAGYRFPNRRGAVSIGVTNLFDQSFNFQERTPSLNAINAPTYARELTAVARATFRY